MFALQRVRQPKPKKTSDAVPLVGIKSRTLSSSNTALPSTSTSVNDPPNQTGQVQVTVTSTNTLLAQTLPADQQAKPAPEMFDLALEEQFHELKNELDAVCLDQRAGAWDQARIDVENRVEQRDVFAILAGMRLVLEVLWWMLRMVLLLFWCILLGADKRQNAYGE